MPWNGSGTFNRIFSWVADKAAGLDISSSRMDTDTDDIASSGFGNCLTRDGQGQPTANLPMAGFRHTGVQDGVAVTDYSSLGQAQNGLLNWTVAGGTADAITANYTPALTLLNDGQLCFIRATAANATTTPTFQVNGAAVHTITRKGGTALLAGDIPAALAEVILRYNLAHTRWELLNPAIHPFTYVSNVTISQTAATLTTLLSGTGSYTSPAGCTTIRARLKGGGGGGGGSGTASQTNGTAGHSTTFGSVTAAGGGAGAANSGTSSGTGGAGGASGAGSATLRLSGGNGGDGGQANALGGNGGGGSGGKASIANNTSATPAANSGGGGAGAPSNSASFAAGGGGGEGEYVELLAAAGTYSYTVAATANNGQSGTSGFNGGSGAAGYILIDEYYAPTLTVTTVTTT